MLTSSRLTASRFAITRDVTARTSAERDLRASQERFRTLVANSRDPILVTDVAECADLLQPRRSSVYSGLSHLIFPFVSLAFARAGCWAPFAPPTKLAHRRSDSERLSARFLPHHLVP